MRPLNQQFEIIGYDKDGQEVSTVYTLNTSQAYELAAKLLEAIGIQSVKVYFEGISGDVLIDTLSK